ncbi:MAG: hypothetical protein JJE22_13490 [Bacteroidia bacterium]|nr:hypothetical protein [Bacteroidia bacterium]
MKNTSLHKSFLFFILLFTGHLYVYAQDCTVDMEQLKGTYTGECKKGKAHGEGKAVGMDTYEGQFKSGLPDGNGVYTWSNGSTFKGAFQKGLKNGDGEMTYKFAGKPDSIVNGFWKKDIYIGRYEYPYKVLTKTKKVTRVEIKPASSGEKNQITIWISSTSGGAMTLDTPSGVIPKVQITNLILQKGNYGRTYNNDSYPTKSETFLYIVSYPLQMRIDMGGESVEVLINEQGSYIIDITINQ